MQIDEKAKAIIQEYGGLEKFTQKIKDILSQTAIKESRKLKQHLIIG